jgi:eukaryotic-like serine/threonine-protein kinase
VTEPVTFKYRAFLSYSHRDGAWAKWLHAALESYPIDRDLVGRLTPLGPVPGTLRPIFRDRDDFSAGHSLTEQTTRALEASQCMIVLCSASAAKSPYVNEEIRRFKAFGRTARIMPLIIGGEPGDAEHECFPPALRFKLGPDGALSDERDEPIAADARPSGDGKNIAKLKLIAGLLGIGFDEIVRRADHAQRRRTRIWGAIAGAFLILAVTAAASAVYAYNKLIESEENLDHAVEFAYGFVSEAAGQADRYGVSVETTANLLRRAEQALDSLVKAGRNTAQLRYRQSLMLLSFADNYHKLGQTRDAIERAQAAQMGLAEIVMQFPDRTSWQRDLAMAHNKHGDIQSEQGALAQALDNYRHALDILQRLTGRDATRLDWRIDHARTLEKIGNVLSDGGSLAGALDAYRQALDTSEAVLAHAADNSDALQSLSIAHQRVGYVLSNQGSMATALDHYRTSLALRERLTLANPENTRWQRDLLALHNEIGDALKRQGSQADALAAYRRSHDIAERLSKSDPRNAQWQRELTIAYLRIGDLLLTQRLVPDALTNYRAGLAVAERLSAGDPNNLTWLRDVAIWHDRVARVEDEREQWEAALASYRKSVAITERLVQSNSANAVWLHDLALAYNRIGDLLIARAKLDEARKAFNTSLALTEDLAARDPSNAVLQRDIAVLLGRMAWAFRGEGKFDEAIATDRKALARLERLTAADSADTGLRRDIMVSHKAIGDALVGLGATDEALQHFRTALQIAERLTASDGENAQWQLDLATLQLNLALLGDERAARLQSAATLLRGLKAAAKLSTQQETLLMAVESMLGSSPLR